MASLVKSVALISLVCGLLVQAWLGAREWPPLLWLTVGGGVAGFAAVRISPAWGWVPLLVTAYVYPAVFWATREFFTFSYYAIFLAGLTGGIAAAPRPLRWHLPLPWRLPLGYWALVLAVGWPILAARETDFRWDALADQSLANSGLGGPPAVIIVSMLVAVLPQIAGILWFDAMFAAFPGRDPARFRRAILLPLAASLFLSCTLAIYQWLFDLTFLSSHQWPLFKRAAGGLLDGNASGQLFGLWSGPALAWALSGGLPSIAIGLAASALTWLAMWGSGSRMALLAAVMGLASILYAALLGGSARVGRAKLFAGVGALTGLAAVLFAVVRFESDPLTRTMNDLPKLDGESIATFVDFQFWNRFGPFGTASVRMIEESPVVGVGAGTFEPLYVDYAYVVTNGSMRSHFDNAQSWYRHQLVELGFLGSLGWMVWIVIFAAFLWRTAPARAGLTEATGVKAAIVALAAISVISMPTRNVFVGLSFWVFAYWLLALSPEAPGPGWLARLSGRPLAWAVLIAGAIIFAAATGWVGYRQFRPPHRAMMANWDYVNGVSRPVQTSDGIVRYTQSRGVAVIPAVPGAHLRLQFQVAHRDAASSPVRVKVYQGGVQVAHFLIRDRRWQEIYVPVPAGGPRLMLEFTVDRPAPGDVPARGLIVRDWEFVSQPPQGAMIAVPR